MAIEPYIDCSAVLSEESLFVCVDIGGSVYSWF